MEVKTCTQCKTEQEIENFYPQQQIGKNGQVWKYRDCMCKYCRGKYSSNRRRQIKRLAVEYLGGKCIHCGLMDEPTVYDFHHRNPAGKDFSISNTTRSFEKIKDELDKCDLLCSHCHRKLHNLTSP